MESRTVCVRFTDPFLETAKNFFSENDLRELAEYLADFPSAGFVSEESTELRWLNWHSSIRSPKLGDFTVWYLAHKDVPRIDVLALILPGEKVQQASDEDVAEVLVKVALIGRLLYRAYRVHEWAREFLDRMLDLGA